MSLRPSTFDLSDSSLTRVEANFHPSSIVSQVGHTTVGEDLEVPQRSNFLHQFY